MTKENVFRIQIKNLRLTLKELNEKENIPT